MALLAARFTPEPEATALVSLADGLAMYLGAAGAVAWLRRGDARQLAERSPG